MDQKQFNDQAGTYNNSHLFSHRKIDDKNLETIRINMEFIGEASVLKIYSGRLKHQKQKKVLMQWCIRLNHVLIASFYTNNAFRKLLVGKYRDDSHTTIEMDGSFNYKSDICQSKYKKKFLKVIFYLT